MPASVPILAAPGAASPPVLFLLILAVFVLTPPSHSVEGLPHEIPPVGHRGPSIPAPIPESPSDSAPGCPYWTFVDSPYGPPLEHTDEVCDRSLENDPYRIEMMRHALARSVETGELRRLEDESTWVCPLDDGDVDVAATDVEYHHQQQQKQQQHEKEKDGGLPPTGPRSVWIVRNEASSPVSVGWINPYDGNSEVSALHPDVSPPHADPEAVLLPGQWHSLEVFLGQTFQVRELVRPASGTGGGGGGRGKGLAGLVPGRVLLRHRPGPVPIVNRYGGPGACPIQALVDPDPQSESANLRARDLEAELARIEENRRKFRRTGFHYNQRCNSLHRVFVNRVGCPVDVYYAGLDVAGHVPSKDGVGGRSAPIPTSVTATATATTPASTGNSTADSSATTKGAGRTTRSPNASNSCFERFKFHLGINPAHADDYVDRWDSPVAFEATYLTHKFVARLRHDPSIVVDEVVIDRTVVRDCPERDSKARIRAAAGESFGDGVMWAEVDASFGAPEVFFATENVGEKFDSVGEAAARALAARNLTKGGVLVGGNGSGGGAIRVVAGGNSTAVSSEGDADTVRPIASKES